MSFARKVAGAVLPFGLLTNALLKKDNDSEDKKSLPSSLIGGLQRKSTSMIGGSRKEY